MTLFETDPWGRHCEAAVSSVEVIFVCVRARLDELTTEKKNGR